MNVVGEHMLARLHLNAVFPCMAAFVRLDEGARSLIAGQRFAVRLKTRSGLSSRLDFLDGEVRTGAEVSGRRIIELLFLTDRQLNNTFTGSGFSFPIPVGGIGQLVRMRTFSTLATRLQDVLMASPPQLADEKRLALHTDLLIGELIPAAVVELAGFDPSCRHWLAPYRDARVRIEVEGGVSSWVRFGEDGASRTPPTRGEPADVVISFCDRPTALAAIHGDLDNLAALGKGRMTVRGLIPLADALGRVLERLGRLMRMDG